MSFISRANEDFEQGTGEGVERKRQCCDDDRRLGDLFWVKGIKRVREWAERNRVE